MKRKSDGSPRYREIAGQLYEMVTELRAVSVGSRLRIHHSNHTTSDLVVIGAYGTYGDVPETGLLCRVVAQKGEGYETVLTPLRADIENAVWIKRGKLSGEVMRHDYEPGDTTHPMSTDPDCRICGETRRTCENGGRCG